MHINAIGTASGHAAGFDATGFDTNASAHPSTMLDPLDLDRADDEVVVTTKRGLIRLALVAADTAARFEREGIEHDPVAWMLAPRVLFEGRSAIDACLGRHECLRAVLLHGLSIGLDAELDELAGLVDGDEEDDVDDVASADDRCMTAGEPNEQRGDFDRLRHLRGEQVRLWTSYLVDERADGVIRAFDAIVAADRLEAEGRLRARHGTLLADAIEITEGFDPRSPMARALVTPALADMLEQIAADPGSPLATGLSVHIEQRFAA